MAKKKAAKKKAAKRPAAHKTKAATLASGKGKSPKTKKAGKRGHAIPEEQYDDILRRSHMGWSTNSIAKHYGVHHVTVQRVLDRVRNSLPPRSSHRIEVALSQLEMMEKFAWENLLSDNPDLLEEQEKYEQVKEDAAKKGVSLKVVERAVKKVVGRGRSIWVDLIKWCFEQRCKILGWYSPERLEMEGEFRVAGLSRVEAIETLAKKALERYHRIKAIEHDDIDADSP